MSRITINGKTYNFAGGSISVHNNVVKINGRTVGDGDKATDPVKVIVEAGEVVSVVCEGDVEAQNIHELDAGGSVTCKDVTGNISCGGSVHAGNVGGDVDCGGSVQCGRVEGSIDAGGSVHHG